MEQPCLLDYCFDAFLSLVHFLYIFHQMFYYMLWGGKCINVPISLQRLVPCSDCAHRFMLGLEIRPRLAGAESDAALPGFQSSYLPLPNRKGQDFFPLVTPTSSVAQPGFTTLSVFYKNSSLFRMGGLFLLCRPECTQIWQDEGRASAKVYSTNSS